MNDWKCLNEYYCSVVGKIVNPKTCNRDCTAKPDDCKLEREPIKADISFKISKDDFGTILRLIENEKCAGCNVKHPTKCNECDIGHLKSRMLMAAYGPKGV
jgi:hypothetical protein